MTKPNRPAMRATRAALLLFAGASLAAALPAQAQPSPSPAPYGYPNAVRQRPAHKVELTEPEGPVTTWDPLRFAVAVETRTSWLFDSGAKRVAETRFPMAMGVSLQGDVFRPSENLALRLDLSWVTGSHSSSQPLSGLDENLDSHLFSLGASLRYHVLRWLAPFARVSGGGGWDELRVTNLKDREAFGQGTLGAGVFLRSPGLRLGQSDHAPALAVQGNLEAGYALGTGSDFVLRSDVASSSNSPIPTGSVPIGHVGRSAPYLRASLGIAF